MEPGFNFCEYNYFNNLTAYMGSADDGRWWDTILVTWGLLESGEDKEKLIPIVDKMIADGVQKGKGIAYGWEFEYAPDGCNPSHPSWLVSQNCRPASNPSASAAKA